MDELGLEDVGTDEAYQAMDWLLSRQGSIETKLARRHLQETANPSRRAYFDLSSSWTEGKTCPLAAFGHFRDGKRGKLRVNYALLANPSGCPVAVRVFPGKTKGPTSFIEAMKVARERFGNPMAPDRLRSPQETDQASALRSPGLETQRRPPRDADGAGIAAYRHDARRSRDANEIGRRWPSPPGRSWSDDARSQPRGPSGSGSARRRSLHVRAATAV